MRRLLTVLMAMLWGSSAFALTLSGRVTDTMGSGVHPIDIDVYVASSGALVNTPDDTTNASGFYSIVLPAGQYNVTFKPAPGSHLFRKSVLNVNLTTNTTLNVTLLRGHYLSGRLVDPQGVGVAFVNLEFRDPVSGAPAPDVNDGGTDASGNYTALVDSAMWAFFAVPPQSSRIVPRSFGTIDLRSDQNLGTTTLERGFLVQGTVTDQGFFPIVDADTDTRPAGTRTKLYTPTDNTDDGGAYSLVLPAGTFDISASPPVGQPYADATARSIVVAADLQVPNIVLPPGFDFRARCKDPGGVAVVGVDLDADSLPAIRRLETENDFSDSGGNIHTLVSAWKFRITLSPPVATKLMPVRFDSIQVSGALDLGDVVFPRGHWVSGTVVESGTGTPIAGANLDFIRKSTGVAAITPGDLTDAAGAFRVVTDGDLYRLRVAPPSALYDTLYVDPFRSLNDTTITLALARRSTAVPADGVNAAGLDLGPPWPNPSRGSVVFTFAASGVADVAVLDLAGRKVAALFHGPANGPRAIRWDGRAGDGRPLRSGVYLIRLAGARAAIVRRAVLVR